MLAKDRCLKKQINLRISIVFVLVIFFSSNLIGSQINDEIAKYLKNMNSFSSKFIQSSGFSIEEGYIYIKDDKKKLDLNMILKRFKRLGDLSNAEKVSGFVIMLTGLLWIFKSKLNTFLEINLTDSGIAISCAFLFFIIP